MYTCTRLRLWTLLYIPEAGSCWSHAGVQTNISPRVWICQSQPPLRTRHSPQSSGLIYEVMWLLCRPSFSLSLAHQRSVSWARQMVVFASLCRLTPQVSPTLLKSLKLISSQCRTVTDGSSSVNMGCFFVVCDCSVNIIKKNKTKQEWF